jgi:hypothetical protein
MVFSSAAYISAAVKRIDINAPFLASVVTKKNTPHIMTATHVADTVSGDALRECGTRTAKGSASKASCQCHRCRIHSGTMREMYGECFHSLFPILQALHLKRNVPTVIARHTRPKNRAEASLEDSLTRFLLFVKLKSGVYHRKKRRGFNVVSMIQ